MNVIQVVVGTLAVLGAAAVGAFVMWVIHRGQQRSKFRERLRIAYVDFFASVNTVQVAKLKLAEDRRMFKAKILDSGRLDASNRQLLDTMTDFNRSTNAIRLLEAEEEFRNEIETIGNKVEAMIKGKDSDAVSASFTDITSAVEDCISTITKTHPLLALKKARSHHRPATSS